jgi:polysaccharide export outer membrane protein
MLKSLHALLLTTAGAVLVAGCAGTDYGAQDLPQDVAEPADDYRIGPGDGVQIFVWDHPDLSTGVQVRPDGKISSPLVEDLQAAGKTPTELAEDIEQVLTEYVRSPVVTVMMQGFQGSVAQQVRVVGQATQPASIQYRQGMTVLDVMIQVGGLSEFASGNRAKVIRKIDGETVEIGVRLDDLLNDGRIDQNIRMYPGDVLIIPESFF